MLVNATVSTLKRPKSAAIIDWEYNNKAPIGGGYKSLALLSCSMSMFIGMYQCSLVRMYLSLGYMPMNIDIELSGVSSEVLKVLEHPPQLLASFFSRLASIVIYPII